MRYEGWDSLLHEAVCGDVAVMVFDSRWQQGPVKFSVGYWKDGVGKQANFETAREAVVWAEKWIARNAPGREIKRSRVWVVFPEAAPGESVNTLPTAPEVEDAEYPPMRVPAVVCPSEEPDHKDVMPTVCPCCGWPLERREDCA